jgi:glucose/arabinose dehydrogenase
MLMALCVCLPAIVLAGAGSSPVSALPPSFADEAVVSVRKPTTVEPLFGERAVVLEQDSGQIRIIDTATGVLSTAIDLNVCATANERGLLGFTTDPDVAATGRVYVYYTRFAGNACVNRVSAFTLSGSTIHPGTEQVLIDNISSINGNHNGGDIEIGNDGQLYIATGDGGRDPRGNSGGGGSNDAAQDRSLLNGKILRVDRYTGLPSVGNPLSGASTVACGSRGNTSVTPTTECRELFAWGLRNPYRFAFDPNTSATRFFINDVGQNTQEEVNEGLPGANYGWNIREGNCPRNETPPCVGPNFGLTDPIASYDHSIGAFITAGAFIPDGVWPSSYDGGYLFADGGSGQIWFRNAAGVVNYDAPFATGKFGITDMAFVMEATGYALYYSRNGANTVSKFTYDTPSATAVGPTSYAPLGTPARLFDSREQNPPAPIRGGSTQLIGLDAPAGATSALVTITLNAPRGEAFATAWEPRTNRPETSNVNVGNGQTVGNASVVPLDSSGRLLLYVVATTDVIIDVSGFFVPAPTALSAGRFIPVDPDRLVDSRDPSTANNEYAVGVGATLPLRRLSVPVLGRSGLPQSGVSAVAMIATGVSVAGDLAGFVRVAPGGRPSKTASLTIGEGPAVRNNLVVVPLGANGTVDVDLLNTGDVVLDVVGWFTDSTQLASSAGRFQLIQAAREIDTRESLGFGRLADGEIAIINPVSVPNSATAVAQNLTVAPSGGASFVTAFPSGAPPLVANLNTTGPGQVRGSAAFTKLGAGSERFFTLRQTELVVDVFGYFT